jgi:hypothetical protein
MEEPQIDTSKPRYKITTLADILAIPYEARPRFLAELPKMLEALDQLIESASDIAAATKWPWYVAWLPNDLKREIVRSGIVKSGGYWVDDDRGLTRLTLVNSKGGEPLYDRTVKTH